MTEQTELNINLEQRAELPYLNLDDVPGLEVRDIIGDYEVITKRQEGTGHLRDFHSYQTYIVQKIQPTILMSANPQILKLFENLNLEEALDTHYLYLNNLQTIAS